MTALNNLKSHNISIDQTTNNNTPVRSTHVKSLFKPKISVVNLIKNVSCNVPEEPPTKRIRNEKCISKFEENDVNNEMSIIQNMFEGINEDEMFDDFCC